MRAAAGLLAHLGRTPAHIARLAADLNRGGGVRVEVPVELHGTVYWVPTSGLVFAPDELAAVASGAGLQWVNSDADKIRAVQEAMASEPKPAHAPRQPKPRATIDDSPLVLVETKKDLSQVRLPFDA